MQMVEKHGKEFRETDVITAFTSMAKWKDSAGNTEVLHSKSFQTLVGTMLSDPPTVHTAFTQCTLNFTCSLHQFVVCHAQIWLSWG